MLNRTVIIGINGRRFVRSALKDCGEEVDIVVATKMKKYSLAVKRY